LKKFIPQVFKLQNGEDFENGCKTEFFTIREFHGKIAIKKGNEYFFVFLDTILKKKSPRANLSV
jgi:hypothetical protein